VSEIPPAIKETLNTLGGSPVANDRAWAIEAGEDAGERGVMGLGHDGPVIRFEGENPNNRESKEAQLLREALLMKIGVGWDVILETNKRPSLRDILDVPNESPPKRYRPSVSTPIISNPQPVSTDVLRVTMYPTELPETKEVTLVVMEPGGAQAG